MHQKAETAEQSKSGNKFQWDSEEKKKKTFQCSFFPSHLIKQPELEIHRML